MKWPRNKPSSLFTRVFSVSWFSKFKQRGGDHDRNSANNTDKNKSALDFPSPTSSSVYRDGRFYSMDEDDAYWRISFGDDRIQPRRSTGGINPLWQQDSDHDLENSIFSSDFKRFGLEEEAEASRRSDHCRNFSEMVSDIKKMRERRGKDVRVSDSRKLSKNPNVDPDHNPGRKLREIKMKTEPPQVKKPRENSKGTHVIKAYSPRTECKIRALEELKRARTKAKKNKKAPTERVVDGNTVFDSFAVAKSSVDPQRDFKDSMVEMIREKGIGHPDDLERLLACYLTLNCDEYHDLIISVFRQVWIELKGAYIDPLMGNVSYFDC